MPGLQNRRWFNPSLPQTLQIAIFLLYFNAFFAALDLLQVLLKGWGLFDLVYKAAIIGSVALAVMGGLGIAEEQKRGYQIALLAAFTPFAVRFIGGVRTMVALSGSPFGIGYDLGDVLHDTILGTNIISLIFEVALITLLLHPQSKDHQKSWFR